MLGKLTRIALLGGLVLLGSTVLAASAYAQTTAYGNVNFTAIYSLSNMANGNGDLGIDMTPPAAPASGSGATDVSGVGSGTFLFHAAASKFGVKSSMDSDMGKITAVIEVDAAGRGGPSSIGSDSSAPHIRLRHAYGTVGNLLLGRTWGGLATDFSWFPTTLDAAGPYGASVVFSDPRMAQVRYTVPMGDNKFVISAESTYGARGLAPSAGTAATGKLALSGENATSLPRLVPAYYMVLGGGIKVQIVAAMTTVRLNETDAAAFGDLDGNGKVVDDLTASGTAFGVNAAIPLGAGVIKVHFLTGSALYQASASFLGNQIYGETDSAGKTTLKLNTGTDMTLSYSHKIDDKSNVNVTYGSISGAVDVKDSANAIGGVQTGGKSASSIHLNYRWNVAPSVIMGVEYATKTMSYDLYTAATDKTDSVDGTASGIVFTTDFAF